MRLAIAAGETSGDRLAAGLARELISRRPDLELAGIAGPAMQAAGVRALKTVDELDVMGLSEVVHHLPRLVRLRREFREQLVTWPARAFIGVDAPDFNLGLAGQLKKRGLFTAQLVAPSVWAWRRYRIPRIARSLDLLLTLFPFEPELFSGLDLDARFVGHPLADELPRTPDRAGARLDLDLPGDVPVVGLLPGSRPGEIGRHARLLVETGLRLRQALPQARLPVLLARPEHRVLFNQAAGMDAADAGLELVSGHTRTGLTACDVVLAASGTVTLEALLLKRPMVVFYRLAPATYWFARLTRLVKTEHVSLPNVLSRRRLVPERIQHQARAGQLAADVLAWLDDPDRIRDYTEQADAIHEQLAQGAAARAAEILLERLAR